MDSRKIGLETTGGSLRTLFNEEVEMTSFLSHILGQFNIIITTNDIFYINQMRDKEHL